MSRTHLVKSHPRVLLFAAIVLTSIVFISHARAAVSLDLAAAHGLQGTVIEAGLNVVTDTDLAGFKGKNQLWHVPGTCISNPSLAQVHDHCTFLTELSPVMVRVGSINKPVLKVRTVMIGEVQEPLSVTPLT